LKALTNVPVYSNPYGSGTLLRTVKPGNIVGKIYSYVVDKAGAVWWMLDDGNGKYSYVKHEPYYFDRTYLENSLKEAAKLSAQTIQKTVDTRTAESIKNGNTMLATGKAIQKTVSAAGDIASGIGDTLSTTVSTAAWLGRNLKVIIIITLVVFLGYYLKKTFA
jgi:hypothetical protein